MLYAAGAAAAMGGFALRGAGGSRRFWLVAAAGLASFALAVLLAQGGSGARSLSVTFLFWYLGAGAAAAAAALRRRVAPWPFLVFAASDVLLIVALVLYRQDAFSWRLPAPGRWGSQAVVVCAAALLRLAAPVLSPDRLAGTEALNIRDGVADGAMLTLGWWQGVLLAAWAGGSGQMGLMLGGPALWLISAAGRKTAASGLCLAGGAVALAAGLGAGHLAVATLGVAGTAFALGELVVPLWAMVALPLSILTTVPGPRSGNVVWMPALAVGMAAAAWRAGSCRPAPGMPVGPAGAAVLAGSALSAAGSAPWLAYGAAASGLFVASATRTGGEQTGAQVTFGSVPAPVVWAGLAVTAAGWVLFAIMAAAGVRAGFLY